MLKVSTQGRWLPYRIPLRARRLSLRTDYKIIESEYVPSEVLRSCLEPLRRYVEFNGIGCDSIVERLLEMARRAFDRSVLVCHARVVARVD
jgi:hypothetical protein